MQAQQQFASKVKIRRHRGSKYEIHSENRVEWGGNDLAGLAGSVYTRVRTSDTLYYLISRDRMMALSDCNHDCT